VFRHLRTELGVEVARAPKKLPYVPAEDEIRRYTPCGPLTTCISAAWTGPPGRGSP